MKETILPIQMIIMFTCNKCKSCFSLTKKDYISINGEVMCFFCSSFDVEIGAEMGDYEA